MAKNITIKKKGVSTDFADVERIKTHDKNDEETLWMPEDETTLTDLFVTDNGTYVAEDDGYYGYRQVEVQASGSLIGRSTEDNNEYYVYEDGNGNLVYEPLPSSIVIDTEPTKMEYEDGELIDLTGAVIKAYKGDGTLWTHEDYPDGIIPLSEITLAPTHADITKVVKGARSDLVDYIVKYAEESPVIYSRYPIEEHKGSGVIDFGEGAYAALFHAYHTISDKYLFGHIIFSSEPFSYERYDYFAADWGTPHNVHTYNETTPSFSYDGKSVYCGTWYGNEGQGQYANAPINYLDKTDVFNSDKAAWTVLYGEKINGQQITIKWNRVVDYKQLNTELVINVTEQE